MHKINPCPIAVDEHARVVIELRILTLVIVLFSRHCLRSLALMHLFCILLLLVVLRPITVKRCSKLASFSFLTFLHVEEEWFGHTRLERAIAMSFSGVYSCCMLSGISCCYVRRILLLYHLPQSEISILNEAISTKWMSLPFLRSISRGKGAPLNWIQMILNVTCINVQLVNSSLTYRSIMCVSWAEQHVWTLIIALVNRYLHLRRCIIV